VSTLVRNVGELVTNEGFGPYRKNGFAFTFADGLISWVGPETDAPKIVIT